MPSTTNKSKNFSIPDKLYFKIGEVSDLLGLKAYVLRYWQTEFPELAPIKSRTNQRLYKRRDVEILVKIRKLLYEENFTINGARKKLKAELKSKEEAPQLSLGLGNEQANDKDMLAEIKAKLLKISSEISRCLAD
jgi:DNA-binding transcriptional MerR regulator